MKEKSTNALRMFLKYYKQPKSRLGIVVFSIILLARSDLVLVLGICAVGFGLKAITELAENLRQSGIEVKFRNNPETGLPRRGFLRTRRDKVSRRQAREEIQLSRTCSDN